MKTIQIDEEVLAELSKHAVGFRLTENDALRRILKLTESEPHQTAGNGPQSATVPKISALLEFIKSERFQRLNQSIDRFLAILQWLHSTRPEEFIETALNYRCGKRVYFAKSKEEIERNGKGISGKPIRQSPIWVLSTLDNKGKRKILDNVLGRLGFSPEEIEVVLAELPDSDIRRSHVDLDEYK